MNGMPIRWNGSNRLLSMDIFLEAWWGDFYNFDDVLHINFQPCRPDPDIRSFVWEMCIEVAGCLRSWIFFYLGLKIVSQDYLLWIAGSGGLSDIILSFLVLLAVKVSPISRRFIWQRSLANPSQSSTPERQGQRLPRRWRRRPPRQADGVIRILFSWCNDFCLAGSECSRNARAQPAF